MSADFRVHACVAARAPRTRQPRRLVTPGQVHLAVMKEALKLAGRDARRIQILTPESVLVVNNWKLK